MSFRPTLLIVDDEKNAREGMKSFLEHYEYEVEETGSPFTALEIIKRDAPDIILTDLRMPEMNGIELLERIKKINSECIVIVFTAYGTVENAVKAMQMGAFHYITKPVNFGELIEILKKARSRLKLVQENKDLRQEIKEKYEIDEIVYKSEEMKSVIETAKQVAPTNASVLILGESGTGKELIAKLIHTMSSRSTEAFVPVHCASLTETLLASELFGHERGSFTGAIERKLGRFERAHKGTLFLDEIGEIKEEMQVKLLRVLQNGEFERVGGTKNIRVDVRIVCATHKNLVNLIKEGRFREDLYYRLNVVSIDVPPLRMRKKDIKPLVEFYIRHYCKVNHKNMMDITPQSVNYLEQYDWPGNVRELKNVIERMVVLSKDNTLSPEHVPYDIKSGYSELSIIKTKERAQNLNIKEMEKELILSALKELNNNKLQVAKKLGISRRTLYRKLEEYNIQ